MFNNLNIKNRGIGGNDSYNLKDRINNVVSCHPKKIFIMVGINDILYDVSSASTFQNISYIINFIKINSPNTIIYIQSILPITDRSKISKINRYNIWLKNYSNANDIRYIDIFSHMFNGVRIYPQLTYDGVHLRIAGNMIWKKVIEQFVK